MEKILLIIIVLFSLLTLAASIFTAIVVGKEAKNKELVKVLSIVIGSIVGAISILAIVILIAGSTIDNKGTSSGNDPATTTTTSESAVESAGFNEVSLDEYLELVKGSDKSIILVARPTCGYCEQFAPVLKEAMEDMNLTINYIDTDKLSEDDWDTFSNSLTYLKEEEWGTPTVLIVQNGESLDVSSGATDLDTIKEFFTKNGFGE